MRKLLVASQKGGVGKTTTSMNLAAATAAAGTRVLLLDADPLGNIGTALNLAEHPHRQSLRQAGIDLPGALVTNLLPGLDVLSPYEEGHCTDGDLDRLLAALAAPATRDCYGCLLVDVPPFLGANPAQLLSSCEDYLLVMRAEAMAYRTLPAFLELVQRSHRDGHAIQMRGILLTLPEGEQPGGRWERELRGRFGARILPDVIPYDETVLKALRLGQISSHLHPDSPAARSYRQLVGKLGLAEQTRPAAAAEQITQTLREAAASIAPTTASIIAPPPVTAPGAESSSHSDEEVDLFATAPPPEIVIPPAPSAPPSCRPEPPLPAPPPVNPSARLQPAASPNVEAVPIATPVSMTPPAPATPSPAPLGQLWPLWILLGAVLGGGLRYFPLPPSALPILVGFGVAILVVVVLRALSVPPAGGDAPTSADSRKSRPRLSRVKKSALRNATKKDVGARLASLTARSGRRGPPAN